MALAELMGATGLSEPLQTDSLLQYELDAGKGLTVKVASDPLNTWGTYAVGHSLWTAAPELIDCLVHALPPAALHGRHVVELGAGLGTVGIALALHGARVTLTDLPVCLELMRHNVAINLPDQLADAEQQVSVRELVWGEERLPAWCRAGGYDWVLASDVCYDSERFQPLLDSILQLAALSQDTKVVMSLPDRTETREFFPLVSASGFAWRVLRRVRREDLVHAVHVYQLVLQPRALPQQPSQQERVLAVWDFDWTLVEDNSDTWVVEQLGAKADFLRLQQEVVGWTELMDAAMAAAASAHGADEAAVRQAARSVPIASEIIRAVKAAAAAGARQIVVSDANTVFIHELLAAHGLQDCIAAVHTNPAAFEGGMLRVRPHAAEPHLCDSICPDNICKGQILERVLLAEQPTRVVYLGDGRGDFCACTRLGPCDAILARAAYPDGRPAALLRLLAAESASIQAATGANCTAADSLADSALPPPPSRPLPEAVQQQQQQQQQQQSESSDGLCADPANGMYGRTSGDGASADAAGPSDEKCPQRCTAADEQQLHTNGQVAGAQAQLQPVRLRADSAAAIQHQAWQAPTDAVAQRRDHQNPDAGQRCHIPELQGAAEAKDFAWPAGDVAAPVLAWATPQECAMLYTTLCVRGDYIVDYDNRLQCVSHPVASSWSGSLLASTAPLHVLHQLQWFGRWRHRQQDRLPTQITGKRCTAPQCNKPGCSES